LLRASPEVLVSLQDWRVWRLLPARRVPLALQQDDWQFRPVELRQAT
jgi:hypothetical protein